MAQRLEQYDIVKIWYNNKTTAIIWRWHYERGLWRWCQVRPPWATGVCVVMVEAAGGWHWWYHGTSSISRVLHTVHQPLHTALQQPGTRIAFYHCKNYSSTYWKFFLKHWTINPLQKALQQQNQGLKLFHLSSSLFNCLLKMSQSCFKSLANCK